MALCIDCGESVPEGSSSCPICGSAVDSSIPCARCGFPVLPGSTRCASCGRILAQPHAYRTTGFRLQGRDADLRASSGALEVDLESDCAWPPAAVCPARTLRSGGSARRHTDPVFMAAFALGLASIVFYWVAVADVALAGAALILSTLGYHRHFSYKHRGRYSGLWLNLFATALGVTGLIAGYGVTAFLHTL